MSTRLASMVLALAPALVSSPANAYAVWFGEDLNNSSTIPLPEGVLANAARADFLSQLVGAGVESFQSKPVGSQAPLAVTFPGANGTLTATLTGGGGQVVSVAEGQTDGLGRYSVPSPGSTNYWFVSVDVAGSFRVNFDQDVGAFGFYGIDIGDAGGAFGLELLDATDNILARIEVGNSVEGTDGSILYFGLVATSPVELFRSVRFVLTPSSADGALTDGFAFDSFTVADPCQIVNTFATNCSPGGGGGSVPEPASIGLVATALLCLGVSIGGSRRRPR